MSAPMIGRLAVITMGAVAVGYAVGISMNITSDKIEEYALGSDKPAIEASGNKHYSFTCDRLYIDGTYINQILAGTPVDVIVYPSGTTATGKPKYTLKSVILGGCDFKADQKGVVTERFSGVAADFTVGTT